MSTHAVWWHLNVYTLTPWWQFCSPPQPSMYLNSALIVSTCPQLSGNFIPWFTRWLVYSNQINIFTTLKGCNCYDRAKTIPYQLYVHVCGITHILYYTHRMTVDPKTDSPVFDYPNNNLSSTPPCDNCVHMCDMCTSHAKPRKILWLQN